jgi:hypothetical protein
MYTKHPAIEQILTFFRESKAYNLIITILGIHSFFSFLRYLANNCVSSLMRARLWTFRFQDPISYLILFSWSLRIWAVTAVCYAFEVDFSKDQEKEKIEPSEELDPQKSIMVVADTHLGLKKEKQNCDPQAVSDFLHWVELLEKKGKDYIKLGKWGVKSSELTVKPPEKMISLGDILEILGHNKRGSGCM